MFYCWVLFQGYITVVESDSGYMETINYPTKFKLTHQNIHVDTVRKITTVLDPQHVDVLKTLFLHCAMFQSIVLYTYLQQF